MKEDCIRNRIIIAPAEYQTIIIAKDFTLSGGVTIKAGTPLIELFPDGIEVNFDDKGTPGSPSPQLSCLLHSLL